MTIPFAHDAQVLTEVCDNGSIFDLFSKRNTTLKLSTAWRIARECAGYWHTRHIVIYHNFDSTCYKFEWQALHYLVCPRVRWSIIYSLTFHRL
jgi:hypothetical protein